MGAKSADQRSSFAMLTAEAGAGALVEQAIVDGRALPAHAAYQSERLHLEIGVNVAFARKPGWVTAPSSAGPTPWANFQIAPEP